jgi:hypothetical protein
MVGFQFLLILRPVFIYIYSTYILYTPLNPEKRFSSLKASAVCIQASTKKKKKVFFFSSSSSYIVYIHTRLFYFASPLSSCLLLFWLLQVSPLKTLEHSTHRHSLLCLQDMCYRLIHRRDFFFVLDFVCVCVRSNEPEKHTTHTYTQPKRRERFSSFLFFAGVERKELN